MKRRDPRGAPRVSSAGRREREGERGTTGKASEVAKMRIPYPAAYPLLLSVAAAAQQPGFGISGRVRCLGESGGGEAEKAAASGALIGAAMSRVVVGHVTAAQREGGRREDGGRDGESRRNHGGGDGDVLLL